MITDNEERFLDCLLEDGGTCSLLRVRDYNPELSNQAGGGVLASLARKGYIKIDGPSVILQPDGERVLECF